ncbi:MAG: hypothetical protein D3917_13610 [Candidatus Electrothrix sp. AX5]|nr:hypothetical protein [Candidatus Electrothrix sp. AX5]
MNFKKPFLSKRTFCIMSTLALCGLANIGWCLTYDVTPSGDADCTDEKCHLQAALDAAELNNGEDNTIRLAQGEYVGNFGYFPSGNNIGGLTVTGGWNADFSVQVLDPANTILNGNNLGTVLNLKSENLSNPAIIKGDLTVEGLTITKGKGYIGGGLIAFTAVPSRLEIKNCILENNHADDAAGGCAIGVYDFVSTTLGGETYLLNNIIRNNDVVINGAGCAVISTGLAVISNNLVYGNTVENTTTDDYPDAGGLDLSPLAGDYYVVNNTITGNQVIAQADSDASAGGVRLRSFDDPLGPIHAYLYNNIIYNNSVSTGIGDDIAVYIDNVGNSAGSFLKISHSAYGGLWVAHGADSIVPTLENNITWHPFLSTESSSLYNLTPLSPCIDAGSNSSPHLPVTDLAGNIRVWDGDTNGTATADMGCYEYDSQEKTSIDNSFLPALYMLLNK